jgi:DNA-binding NtrC family response regulator
VGSLQELSGAGVAAAIVTLTSAKLSVAEQSAMYALKQKSAYVICLVQENFDLKGRCELLLAGASAVLYVRSENWMSTLRELVERASEKCLQADSEEKDLMAIMRRSGFAARGVPAIRLFRTVRRVSSLTDLPVLITGETGTGKELLACAIHSLDAVRSRKPFVAVNCAALPQHISESELFGHCRGAFTGADRERKGVFRSADSGILFLDEIGELSLDLQAKLLRVLQTRRVKAVGSDQEVEVDVRIIAATNRSLEQMVAAGTFREDLLHRLNVVHLHIPPLRERPEDIEPLIDHFMEKYLVVDRERQRPAIDHDFVLALQQAPLPGNARQLENIFCRALLGWEGDCPLSLNDLPEEIWREVASRDSFLGDPSKGDAPNGDSASSQAPQFEDQAVEYLRQHDWNLTQAVRHLESTMVRGAMSASGGNQSEAARLLGITPRSVYNKLHKIVAS